MVSDRPLHARGAATANARSLKAFVADRYKQIKAKNNKLIVSRSSRTQLHIETIFNGQSTVIGRVLRVGITRNSVCLAAYH